MDNRLLSKEKMFNFLESSRCLLNRYIYEYLEDIVNLDYSVVRDYITREEREALSKMQLYRSCLIYNIQKREKEFFDKMYDTDDVLLFGFNIQSGDLPCITLYNWICDSEFLSDKVMLEKLELIKGYINYIKTDYGLTDEQLEPHNLIVKKMPGLIIRQNMKKY